MEFSFILLQSASLLQDIAQISIAILICVLVMWFGSRFFTSELNKKDQIIQDKDKEISELNLQIRKFIQDIFENNTMISGVMDKLLTGQLKGNEKVIEEIKANAKKLEKILDEIKSEND